MTESSLDDLLEVPGNRKIAEAALLAKSFRTLAGAGLHLSVDESAHVMAAVVPTLAFSIELYLKAIGAVEQRVWHRGHDLRTIFDKLLPATRQALRERYDSQFGSIPPEMLKRVHAADVSSFETVLTRSRRAFEELRYSFESAEVKVRQLPDGFGFLWATDVLARYLNELPLPVAISDPEPAA